MYAVPPGFTLIWKNLALQNQGQPNNLTSVYIRTPNGSAQAVMLTYDFISRSYIVQDLWVVLNAGDEVHIALTSSPVGYWLSGALLPD